jgi:hypothetical protein
MAQYCFYGEMGGAGPQPDDEDEFEDSDDSEDTIDDIADREMGKYRTLPLPVRRALIDNIAYSAEFYMQKLLKHFNGDASKRFSEQELKEEYPALFREVMSACGGDDKKVSRAAEYLVLRLNGGEMLPTFAGFREDVRESMAATFGPAEGYFQARIFEEGIEGELCTVISLAGPERWEVRSKINDAISELCGWDAPKKKRDQDLYEAATDYVIARLQV